MRTLVSQGTMLIDGKPACSRCGRRPRRWSGGRWQSYCTPCHQDYSAERRAGKVEVLLTPEEWAAVKASRAAAAIAGRHRKVYANEHPGPGVQSAGVS